MAEFASVECLRDESCECVEFIEYLEDVEADILDLELVVEQREQLSIENETQENKGLETMMTYFMILEEELTIEKQKAQRLQKLNQEMDKDRLETEERSRELIKQKHALETENQQLRQRLWKMKDLFTKSADELWQLRRQNRMLHEILQRNTTSARRESESSQTLPRCEGFQKQAHQNDPQLFDHSDDNSLDTCVSEPNIQHLLRTDDDDKSNLCRRDHSSLLQNFITSKQAQQKNGDVEDANAEHLEGKSKQLKHETEPLVEGSTQPHNKAVTESEDIPIMPAPLPKDLLLRLCENGPEVEMKQPREKDMNKLEERNSDLTKALQKLEIQHSELKSHHDRLSKIFNNIKRQDPVDHVRIEIPRRRVLARKARSGSNALEEVLLKAVKSGCARKVREAISEGADVNLTLVGRWTPLHIAAACGHGDVCHELLDAGAMKHARDRWGDTPLHWAAVNGHQEVANILAHRGADVSRRGRGNATPREKALAAGHGKLAQWFTKQEQEQLKGNTAP